MDSSATHRWFLPSEGRSKRETMDSFVLPALVMPGGRNHDSDPENMEASRRQSTISMMSQTTRRTSHQPQLDYFNVKISEAEEDDHNARTSVGTDVFSPFTPSPFTPSPSMFPAPPSSTASNAIQSTTLTTRPSRTSLQPIPASPLTTNWPTEVSPVSPTLSDQTLISPTQAEMQKPGKTYSPVQEQRPTVPRLSSANTTTSISTAQSTQGLAPLTRQPKRESWQSSKSAGRQSYRKSNRMSSSLQTVEDGAVLQEKPGGTTTDSPVPPPPAVKSYTTFTGFRPYSVHSSYTYVDDGESEVGVPAPDGGLGGIAGKPVFLDSDGLPVRPTAEMMERQRKRRLIVRWAWGIGTVCMIAIVVGIAVGLMNAFSPSGK